MKNGIKYRFNNTSLPVKVKVFCTVKKILLGEFESIRQAANFAGVDTSTVQRCRKNKCKNRMNNLNTIITFR